ncbi:MAG: DUF4112 domain-containing protein [Rhodospirillaceae bacterium]|nr:DUF4112 domain-containing protein [Rhodospirillaceae bacterium]
MTTDTPMAYVPAAEMTIDDRDSDSQGPRARGDTAPMDTTPEEALVLERLAALSRLLDHAFRIPGTDIRFGLDAVLGLLPGIGDVLTNLISAYLVIEARRLGLPRWDMARMIGNIVVDAGVSAVPVAGDIFDIFWRANDRNMSILREHLERRGRIIDGDAVRIG